MAHSEDIGVPRQESPELDELEKQAKINSAAWRGENVTDHLQSLSPDAQHRVKMREYGRSDAEALSGVNPPGHGGPSVVEGDALVGAEINDAITDRGLLNSVNNPAGTGSNARQVGGSHYGLSYFQHWDMVALFDLDYFQGQITKYIMRWRAKNGIEDLEKAQHYLEKYIEIERARTQGSSE